jgi:hypothetical protein
VPQGRHSHVVVITLPDTECLGGEVGDEEITISAVVSGSGPEGPRWAVGADGIGRVFVLVIRAALLAGHGCRHRERPFAVTACGCWRSGPR